MLKVLGHVRANAIAYVALFVALGGTGAWAAAQIGARDIKENAVRSKHIKDGQVKGADLLDNSVGGEDIDESSLQNVVPGEFHFGFYSDTTEDTLAQLAGSAILIHDDGDVDTNKEVEVEHTGAGGQLHVLTDSSAAVTIVTAGNSQTISTAANVLDLVVQASGGSTSAQFAISVHCSFDPSFEGSVGVQPEVSCFSMKSKSNG